MFVKNCINPSHKILNLILFISLLFSVRTIKASDPDEHTAIVHDSLQEHAAAGAHHEEHDGKVNIGALAIEHILDSHAWHLWGHGEDAVSIHLPVIFYSNKTGLNLFSSSRFGHGEQSYNGYSLHEEKIVSEDESEKIYDISITKNVVQMMISMLILFGLFISIAKSYGKTGVTNAPKGKQSFFEPLIVFVRDDIAKSNIGKNHTKFVPFLLTVFFFILINNVLGMLPIGANLTGNIAFTFVLSFITLIVTNINGNANYWHHLFLPPAPKWLYPILIPIEIVGIFTKPFALMIRLFANMSAGHIIIISLIGLIFIFKSIAVSPISIAFALFIDVLECLVAFLQAYVFTMLTALFIGSAVEEHHHDHEGHSHENEASVNAKH
jgi:F-type H+-transporting ATPase subunit a